METAPPSAELDMVGGRYRLLQRLVAQSDAAPGVWRGQDTVLNRPVMVIVQEPGGATARFLIEYAHAMSLVEHPSLPRVFDAADEGNRAWVVTEWVEGSTLAALLADGPFDAQAAAATIAKLAEGVALAHQAGIAVGLLDTRHVVITPRGTVTVTRLAVATPVTAYDDVRHLGALLYATLTSTWPLTEYGGAQPAGLVDGRLPSPRQVRAGVPTELSSITMRALDPHQPDPLVTTQALADALTRWQRNAEPHPFVAELPVEERYVAPDRRRRWAPLATFLAAVCAIALVGLLASSLLGSGTDNTGLPPGPGTAGTPSYTTVPPGPVGIISTTMYDPAGDGMENPGEVGLAADGDPRTAWQTLQYKRNAAFGNLKPGVGLIFDLGRSAKIRAVRIQTNEQGTNLEVRVGNAAGLPLSGYRVVGRASQIGATTEIPLDGSATGQFYLVWFTRLAPVGAFFQGDLAEVQFLP